MLTFCQSCRYTVTDCCCGFPDYVRLEEEEEEYYEVSYDERMELVFYNQSDVWRDLVVDPSQSTMDICELLADKFNVAKSVHLSIFEYWEDLALERPLEDDESVAMAYYNMRMFSFHARLKYIFKNNFKKYEFLHYPEQFIPAYMLDTRIPIKDDDRKRSIILRHHMVAMMSSCPDVISQVYIQEDPRKSWKRVYMLLKDQDILISQKKKPLIKLMRSSSEQLLVAELRSADVLEGAAPRQPRLTVLPAGVHVFANLSRYLVYRALDARRLQRAPTSFCIVLRPGGSLPRMAEAAYSRSPSGGKGGLLRCIACDSERVRSCWVLAMRLAKFGKQISENYREIRNRRAASKNEQSKRYKKPSDDPENPHVPMDFSDGDGKIILDPKEANAVAAAEAHAWRRRLRHGYSRPPAGGAGPSGVSGHRAIDFAVHLALPWFFANMPRERAVELLVEQGTVDGVFLVRNSRSNKGSYVISYMFNQRVIHQPIQMINEHDELFLTIDGGSTRFYDLQQLVEFYRLNRGCLPTRLTYYVSLMLSSFMERGPSTSASTATSPTSTATSPKGSKSPSASSAKRLFSSSAISLFGCISKPGSSREGSPQAGPSREDSSKAGPSRGDSSQKDSSKGGSSQKDSSKRDSSKKGKGGPWKGGSSKGGSSKGGSSKGG